MNPGESGLFLAEHCDEISQSRRQSCSMGSRASKAASAAAKPMVSGGGAMAAELSGAGVASVTHQASAPPSGAMAMAPSRASVVRKRIPISAEIDDVYEEDVRLAMGRITLQKSEEPQIIPSMKSANNTALIRVKEEQRMDEYRRANRTMDVPGRLSEDQLMDVLLNHRCACVLSRSRDVFLSRSGDIFACVNRVFCLPILYIVIAN